ncbi:MAG: acyl-CoA thioesterase [Povalibacter sp.]
MNFSSVLDTLTPAGDGAGYEYEVTITDDWSQGRATFGGLIAGVANEALRQRVPRERVLRSLQTTFVGPASAGTWQLNVRVLRVGKAVTVASCEVSESNQVAATIVAVYGGPRSSVLRVDPPAPELVPTERYLAGEDFISDAPRFTSHFDMHWTKTQPAYSGQVQTHTQTRIRHRNASQLSESHVVALVDCIPTPGLTALNAPAPASSLVWTLELLDHRFDFAGDAWWRLDTTIDAAADGYINQTGVLTNPEGRTAALSRQLFTIFG